MVSLEVIAIVLTGIGIIVSILYYTSVLRNTNKNRELQIFMDIYRVISTEDNQRTWAELLNAEFIDYDDYMNKFDSSINPEHFGKRGSIWWNYNTIGYLLEKGHISTELVDDLVASQADLLWDKWGDIIQKVREKQGISKYFTGYEYLVKEIRKHRKEIT